ncbi:unnamed protein product, partial [Didymodactylos carnosus]
MKQDSLTVSLENFRKSIPRLEVLHLPMSNQRNDNESLGTLVIVDNPGPNESRASLELNEIVTNELSKATLILVVINYTQMNTEAAEKIREQINDVRDRKGDKDCLYALINKVDQRRTNTVNKKDLQRSIETTYDIHSDKRIFEVKAVHALASRKFAREYAQLHDENRQVRVEDMLTAEDFAREVYGGLFDDRIEQGLNLEELLTGAPKLWKSSGFEEFLRNAFEDLVKIASTKCIRSAVGLCEVAYAELKGYITLRLKALKVDAENLRQEIVDLENDLH